MRVEHHGQVTRFFRRGNKFFVNALGPDGVAADFPVTYTFGVYPLQQYLIPLPGGRLQALGVAWDARSQAEGGQRWFHLYPDGAPEPGETTHWTGRDQNWNFMCAACHSTNLQKNYDPVRNNFKTSWSDLNVGCEACHGPGSQHLQWARGNRQKIQPGLGLWRSPLAARSNRFTFTEAGQRIARLQGDVTAGQRSGEVCYGCHSRRQELLADRSSEPDAPYLDHYLPTLIEQNTYHADGQIDGEVFEVGSFLQSAMHRAGVTCSHCHEVHSLKLRVLGNGLCAQCHQPMAYDSPAHHRHAAASEGAQCVACHMPVKVFMGVHARRDHSLRVPRPDISQHLGMPNACNQCHRDKGSAWAAAAVYQWKGERYNLRDPLRESASAIAQSWSSVTDPNRLLRAFRNAPSGFVKASLLSQLSSVAFDGQSDVLRLAAESRDGLQRLGAARALSGLSAQLAWEIGEALLTDPLRAVRIEAARSLLAKQQTGWAALNVKKLSQASQELIAAELTASDRPEAHVNLAMIYINMKHPGEAENALLTALRLDERFVPAMVNLADLYRLENRDTEGEELLRKAATIEPKSPEVAHSLGLLLIRRGCLGSSLHWLDTAVRLAPWNTNYRSMAVEAKKQFAEAPASPADCH